MSLEISDHTTILNELNKAVKALRFYPDEHPKLNSIFDDFMLLLREKTGDNDDITWVVSQKGFLLNDTPLSPSNTAIAQLAMEFFMRRINLITFKPQVTSAELKTFFSILNIDREKLQSLGGAGHYLAKGEVRRILIDKIHYETVEEEEEEEEKEEGIDDMNIKAKAEDEPELAGYAQAKGHEIKPEEVAEADEGLEELLERIKDETDKLKHNDLSLRIAEKAQALLLEKQFERVFPVLDTFLRHTDPDYPLDGGAKSTTTTHLQGLLGSETILYLVRMLEGKKQEERELTQRLLLAARDDVLGTLVGALIDTSDVSTRRHIFNTIVLCGERIRPAVEDKLNDSRWYAVRQMVTVLGELAGPRSLEMLEQTYAHTDIRVKKEVLKALGRIPTDEPLPILTEALKSTDHLLQGQAAISLGVLKDASAVERLGEMILSREPFAESQELKKEIFKGLGMIGDEAAVPYIEKFLSRRVWFGKTGHDALRISAVSALGKIGGQSALEVVEEAADKFSGELGNHCKKVLAGLKK